MAGREQPYDPYIPSGGAAPGAAAGNGGDGRTAALQAQIDDTVDVMRENMDKVLQREQKVTNIAAQADRLASSAQDFHRGANRTRKHFWWKDMKMRMCLIAGIIILILVIVVPTVVLTKH